MYPDDFFHAVESRQIAESAVLTAINRTTTHRRTGHENLRLPASERGWKDPRVCECGYSTTWPPAWGSHRKRCEVVA